MPPTKSEDQSEDVEFLYNCFSCTGSLKQAENHDFSFKKREFYQISNSVPIYWVSELNFNESYAKNFLEQKISQAYLENFTSASLQKLITTISMHQLLNTLFHGERVR